MICREDQFTIYYKRAVLEKVMRIYPYDDNTKPHQAKVVRKFLVVLNDMGES